MNQDYFKNIDVPFDALKLPSMGLFYSSKTSTLYVKYITAKEENILTQPSLMESGFGLDLVLDSVIINKEIEIDDLLIGDKQSLLIYLRSTAYGDNFPVVSSCPACNISGETEFQLSSFGAKELEEKPDENGLFEFTLPKMKLNGEKVTIKFKPLRVRDEIEINKIIDEESKSDKKYSSSVTLRFNKQIVSINGINDQEFIKKVIKKLPIKDSTELRIFMEKVEPGIDTNISITCKNCDHTYSNNLNIDSNIFYLDPSYKNNLWEEIFLIWYYGKGVNRSDIYNMSTVERRWSLQRISEEVDKKNQAEQAAVDKAKRK